MTSLAGLGRPSVVAALCFAGLSVALSVAGARSRRGELVVGAVRALYATGAFTMVAAAALLGALLARDFSLSYVASYSSSSLSVPYTLAALWGGMEGSLLFWTVLLTAFAAIALRRAAGRDPAVLGWTTAVLAGVTLFFLLLLAVPADPFAPAAEAVADGRGLNPLLQSPGMIVHPPLLYTGFVGFSIPFAFAVGALLAGHEESESLASTRRWTLFAWCALSIGIVIGGAWAYTELGWGGYWAWDPVENASFMPWLTATAYLHSVVIQEKRRMFKVWNVSLILLTYALAVFGTFLTRSGILSSIHTFTEGPIGKWFLPFLAFLLVGGIALIAFRVDRLKSENRFDSPLSRESAFLANNVLFVAAAVTVLWGTIYPVVAEVVTGVRLSVGPPFFNAVFIPLGISLVVLSGLGPLLSWRRTSKGVLRRVARTPLVAAVAVVAGLAATGVRSVGAIVAFGACVFTAVAVGAEFRRGSKLYRRRDVAPGAALVQAFRRNRRRYGGYVVHLGVVLIVVGFAGSAFRTERQAVLREGQTMRVGDYNLVYTGSRHDRTDEKSINVATIAVFRGGSQVATLAPQRNYHFAQEQPQSEVAIRSTPVEDLYLVVRSFDRDGDIALTAFVNPLTWWIWAGAAVMLAGMSVLLSGAATVAETATLRRASAQPAAVTR